jgi:tRNA(Ile2) C34 agmatinyltransferase TiaS
MDEETMQQDSVVCPECGSDMKKDGDMMTCEKCGHTMPAGDMGEEDKEEMV